MKRMAVPKQWNDEYNWEYICQDLPSIMTHESGMNLFLIHGYKFEIYSVENEIKEIFSYKNIKNLNYDGIDRIKNLRIEILNEKILICGCDRYISPYVKNIYFDPFTKNVVHPDFKKVYGKYDKKISRVGNTGIITGFRKNNRFLKYKEEEYDERYRGYVYVDFFLEQEEVKLNEIIIIKFHPGSGISYKIMEIADRDSEVLEAVVDKDQLTATALIKNPANFCEIVTIDLE